MAYHRFTIGTGSEGNLLCGIPHINDTSRNFKTDLPFDFRRRAEGMIIVVCI